MTGRTRSLNRTRTVTGTYVSRGVSGSVTYQQGLTKGCVDTVGDWDKDNLLSIDSQYRTSEVVEGTIWNTSGTAQWGTYSSLPLLIIARGDIPNPTAKFPRPNFSEEKLLWLARMQPGKPAFNLPTFLGEARDIPNLFTQVPDLIRSWGRARIGKHAGRAAKAADLAQHASRSVGSLWLGYKFGLSPLMSDFLAMLGLLDAFLRALEDLNDLAKGKHLKRSLRLPPQRILEEPGWVITQSIPKIIRHNKVLVFNSKSWVTSRWAPLFPWVYTRMSASEKLALARRQLLGLSASGLIDAWWELLPWSWLADWIARVQAQLGLFTGSPLLLKCVSLCWCRTTTCDVYWSVPPGTLPKGHIVEGTSFWNRVVKERLSLADVALEPAPIELSITAGRASILAALIAQYGDRRLPLPKRGR